MNTETILADLIGIQSYSGEEENIAQYIENYCTNKQLTVIRYKGNVLVHIKKNAKKALIFNCHMDTVPLHGKEHWNTNPFKLSKDEHNYYGLGVSDEKISIAITLAMIDYFKASDIQLDIFLMFVIKEEIDGTGSLIMTNYFKDNYSFDTTYAIVCEPRNAQFLGIGNKGSIFFELHSTGVSCHASEPRLGKNAITYLLSRITQINTQVESLFQNDEIFSNPTICFPTMIHGGNAVNIIPENARAKGDIRTTPAIHQKIVSFLEDQPDITIISEIKPCYQDPNDELVAAFNTAGIIQKTTTNGSNDMIFHTQVGHSTIVFGAGAEEACHIVNEFCPIINVDKTIDIYKKVCEQLGQKN